MSDLQAIRKPLGVRATLEEHRLLTDAAKREHRSLSSFVLRAALDAANAATRRRTPAQVQEAIDRAQALMRPHRRSGQSLMQQLVADRRAEAAGE